MFRPEISWSYGDYMWSNYVCLALANTSGKTGNRQDELCMKDGVKKFTLYRLTLMYRAEISWSKDGLKTFFNFPSTNISVKARNQYV